MLYQDSLHRHPPEISYPDFETRYVYDAKVNKQIALAYDGSTPAAVTYSDRPSLYSLNPVWKIINKDYSKNSIKTAVAT